MYTSGVTYLVQLLVSAFLAILFLQSGIDKIVDRQGNLEWLSGHFAKSPFAGMVPLLFGVLTIIELAARALSAIGFLVLIVFHIPMIAVYGGIVSWVAIVCLFLGQRLSNDYAGAAILLPYCLLPLLAISLVGTRAEPRSTRPTKNFAS